MEHIPLPGLPASHWLHLKFHLSADNLRIGPQPWSDGRLILEWRTATLRQFDAICSVRDNQDSKIVEVIARPNQGSATPSLHLENLGHSGDFNIHLLEATVVEERALWKIGKWAMLAAWAAWFAVVAGFTKTHLRPWPWIAGGVWLLMALNCSFPGPWKTLRPLTAPFQLGPEVQRPAASQPGANPLASQSPSATTQQPQPALVCPHAAQPVSNQPAPHVPAGRTLRHRHRGLPTRLRLFPRLARCPRPPLRCHRHPPRLANLAQAHPPPRRQAGRGY